MSAVSDNLSSRTESEAGQVQPALPLTSPVVGVRSAGSCASFRAPSNAVSDPMSIWSTNNALRKWRSYVLVVVGAYVLTLAFGTLVAPLRGNLDNLVFDQYQRWRPRPYNFDQPVRIVDIDDESLHLIGRWPWPRQTMADLVDRLAKANVAAIGFDVLFSEKDRPSGNLNACARGAVHSADEVSRCEESADGDVAFAHAIADRPVVLGVFLTPTHNGSQASLATKAGFSFVGDSPMPFLNQLQGALVPIPELADAASGLGFLNWLPDNDRVVRRVPLLLNVNGQIEPSLAMEALRVAQGASGYIVKSTTAFGATAGKSAGVEAIKVGDVVVPVQADGELRVWFAKSDPRRSFPAWKVLQPDADLSDLAGKDRVRRRERLPARGHRRDSARSVDAGGRGACAAHRANPLRRHFGAARLGAGRGALRQRRGVACVGGGPAVRSHLLGRDIRRGRSPASWPISAGSPSRGTGFSSTPSCPPSRPASCSSPASASFTVKSASR